MTRLAAALLLIVAGLAASCTANMDQTAAVQPQARPTQQVLDPPAPPLPAPVAEPTTEPPTAVAVTPSHPHLAPDGARSRYTGATSDGVKISMWVAQEGDFVRGEFSHGNEVPRVLLGQRAGESYLLRAFATRPVLQS